MDDYRDSYTIAQFSDIHCGDARFDDDLMEATIHEINELEPNLVVVAGDLTADGYREQFDEAHSWIKQVECKQKLVIAGNHDCRNVGYLHFEQLFGDRHYRTEELDFRICCVPEDDGVQEKVKILALDSNKPDLNDGEIGRDKYDWIDMEFPEKRILQDIPAASPPGQHPRIQAGSGISSWIPATCSTSCGRWTSTWCFAATGTYPITGRWRTC